MLSYLWPGQKFDTLFTTFCSWHRCGKDKYEGLWLKRAYEECLANKHVKALNEGMSAILTSALSHRLTGASFVQSLHE